MKILEKIKEWIKSLGKEEKLALEEGTQKEKEPVAQQVDPKKRVIPRIYIDPQKIMKVDNLKEVTRAEIENSTIFKNTQKAGEEILLAPDQSYYQGVTVDGEKISEFIVIVGKIARSGNRVGKRFDIYYDGKHESMDQVPNDKNTTNYTYYNRYTDLYNGRYHATYSVEVTHENKIAFMSMRNDIGERFTQSEERYALVDNPNFSSYELAMVPAGLKNFDWSESTYHTKIRDDRIVRQESLDKGFYMQQIVKEGSKVAIENEHYVKLQASKPKKIRIQKEGIDLDFFLTEDGKYKDNNGKIYDLQQMRDIGKQYGFKDQSEGRLARMFREGDYKDDKYPIIPKETKEIVRQCKDLIKQEREETQDIPR